MCEFCTKHGEGKKWYEIMEHYSKEFANDPKRLKFIKDFVTGMRQNAGANLSKLAWVKRKIPLAYRFIRKMATANMKQFHYGQIVPLEDAEKILDMVHSITRIPCICRSITIGKEDARYCLLLGVDPTSLVSDWPELQASLETLPPEQAKTILREFDQKGLIHSIWTFKTPFIGAICNCDRDCMAYRTQIGSGLMNLMFKAEFIAEINISQCSGCRNCIKLCQFGAIEYSATNTKCFINPLKCYGCGVCRSGCKHEAISLFDRTGLPQSN